MRPGIGLAPPHPLRPGGLAVLSFLIFIIAADPVSAQDASACVNRASYACFQMRMSEEPPEGRDFRHISWIRASYDLADGWKVDVDKHLNHRWNP